jgi:hypothetical protein
MYRNTINRHRRLIIAIFLNFSFLFLVVFIQQCEDFWCPALVSSKAKIPFPYPSLYLHCVFYVGMRSRFETIIPKALAIQFNADAW